MHCQSQWSVYLGVGHVDPSNPPLNHFYLAYKEPGLFTRSPQSLHKVSVLSYPWALHSAKGVETPSLALVVTLSRIFHQTHWVIGKACSLCRRVSFQGIHQQAGTGVCVTLSCSQGFPLPSPHPGFTSGIRPVLHNRGQGDSKV